MKSIHLVSSLAAVLATAASTGRAEWSSVHRDAGNNAVAPIAASITDLTSNAQFSTGLADIANACRPIVAGGRVYAVATQLSPERIRIKSFDKTNLTPGPESADLDAGVSVSFGTASAPLVVTADDALYFGTGSTVYRLNASTLTQTGAAWSTMLSATNTSAGAYYMILNSSPAAGGSSILVKTYPTAFGDIAGSQVVSLSKTTGAVEWYAVTGGRGSHSPAYVDLGASKVVIAERQVSNAEIGLRAYDAASTGAATPIWTSSWTLTAGGFHGFWGDMLVDGGKIYTITTDLAFPGPAAGHLIRVDAATGTLDWSTLTIGSDVPPALVGGELIVFADGGNLLRFNPATGAQIGSTVNVGGNAFRNYFAATNDSLYLAQSGNGIRKFTLTGTLQSSSTIAAFGGPVSIDSATGFLYVPTSSGSLNVVTGASGVADWLGY